MTTKKTPYPSELVVCLKCGAKRGEPCFTTGGLKTAYSHRERVLLACLSPTHEAAIRRLSELLDRTDKERLIREARAAEEKDRKR